MRWLLEWLVPPTYRPNSSVGERLTCHGVVGLGPSSGLFFSLTLAAGIFPFEVARDIAIAMNMLSMAKYIPGHILLGYVSGYRGFSVCSFLWVSLSSQRRTTDRGGYAIWLSVGIEDCVFRRRSGMTRCFWCRLGRFDRDQLAA